MTAREHAEKASELLEGIERMDERLAKLDEMEQLQMHATGGGRRANADREYSCRLATAHALTAQALVATTDEVAL